MCLCLCFVETSLAALRGAPEEDVVPAQLLSGGGDLGGADVGGLGCGWRIHQEARLEECAQ